MYIEEILDFKLLSVDFLNDSKKYDAKNYKETFLHITFTMKTCSSL